MAKKKKSVKKGLIIGISSVVVLLAAAYAVWDIISMTIFIREP